MAAFVLNYSHLLCEEMLEGSNTKKCEMESIRLCKLTKTSVSFKIQRMCQGVSLRCFLLVILRIQNKAGIKIRTLPLARGQYIL